MNCGAPPTFVAEAKELIEDDLFPEALERINYAIQQTPNEAEYHNLRGNILQALLRLDEAQNAYEEALRDPNLATAKLNLDLTNKLLAEIGTDGGINPEILTKLYAALIKQGRHSAAHSVNAWVKWTNKASCISGATPETVAACASSAEQSRQLHHHRPQQGAAARPAQAAGYAGV